MGSTRAFLPRRRLERCCFPITTPDDAPSWSPPSAILTWAINYGSESSEEWTPVLTAHDGHYSAITASTRISPRSPREACKGRKVLGDCSFPCSLSSPFRPKNNDEPKGTRTTRSRHGANAQG
eukprot:364085-Amorphochlora_amoeboformis.AAC.3